MPDPPVSADGVQAIDGLRRGRRGREVRPASPGGVVSHTIVRGARRERAVARVVDRAHGVDVRAVRPSRPVSVNAGLRRGGDHAAVAVDLVEREAGQGVGAARRPRHVGLRLRRRRAVQAARRRRRRVVEQHGGGAGGDRLVARAVDGGDGVAVDVVERDRRVLEVGDRDDADPHAVAVHVVLADARAAGGRVGRLRPGQVRQVGRRRDGQPGRCRRLDRGRCGSTPTATASRRSRPRRRRGSYTRRRRRRAPRRRCRWWRRSTRSARRRGRCRSAVTPEPEPSVEAAQVIVGCVRIGVAAARDLRHARRRRVAQDGARVRGGGRVARGVHGLHGVDVAAVDGDAGVVVASVEPAWPIRTPPR